MAFPKNLSDLKALWKMKETYYRIWLAQQWPLAYRVRLTNYILYALMDYPEDLLEIKGEIKIT